MPASIGSGEPATWPGGLPKLSCYNGEQWPAFASVLLQFGALCVGFMKEAVVTEDERSRPEVGGTRVLDLRGKVCPYVTGDAYQALKDLSPASELVVLTDYYPALATLPMLAQDFGGEASTEQLQDRLWRITIRKGGP
ncbi:MAG: sulfurtransferase TusA family protein [Chloroflexota bacterium]